MYREAHTPVRAFSNAPESPRATLGMLSYSPAPDIPARSSTLAVLRTITVLSLPSALPALQTFVESSSTQTQTPAAFANALPLVFQVGPHIFVCIAVSHMQQLLEAWSGGYIIMGTSSASSLSTYKLSVCSPQLECRYIPGNAF